jgi:nucleoside phosphorylase
MDSPIVNLRPALDTILVPQGSEYQAVMKGWQKKPTCPSILAIPVGGKAVEKALLRELISQKIGANSPQGIIVMGLAGSLSPQLKLGQVVLYRSCLDLESDQLLFCDSSATGYLVEKLGHKVQLVEGLSSDRVITEAEEKQNLGKRYRVQVVDMEGAAILKFFAAQQIPVVILRVISDEINQSLPDLSQVYNSAGELQTWPLTKALISQPITGFNLIRSSLYALKILEKLATELDQLSI